MGSFPLLRRLVFACIFLCSPVLAVPHFSEILYDPPGIDNDHEYIELADAGNLTGYVIVDTASNDTLMALRQTESAYALIVEEGFNHSGLNCSVYSVGAAIGDGLSNSGDTLRLYLNTTLITNLSYDGSVLDGHSLSLVNGSWGSSAAPGGTPCAPNDRFIGSPVPEANETPVQEENTTLAEMNASCTLMLGIRIERQRFTEGETVTFHNTLDPRPDSFEIEYWIEDLFGEVKKNPVVTGNLQKKSFTPRGVGEDAVFLIMNRLVSASCGPLHGNLTGESLFVVKGTQETQDTMVRILSVNLGKDELASPDEEVAVTLEVYKGDTTKRVVSAAAYFGERISPTIKLNLPKKDTYTQVTLPLKLTGFCRLEGGSGDARVVVEGLGDKDSQAIRLDFSGCKETIGPADQDAPVTASRRGIEWDITFAQRNFSYGAVARPEIAVANHDTAPVSFTAWSHVYLHRINHSGKKDNLQSFIVMPGENLTIALATDLSSHTGNRTLKVELQKEGNKNPYEKTFAIQVFPLPTIEVNETVSHEVLIAPKADSTPAAPSITPLPLTGAATAVPVEIYTGSSLSARRLAPYLLAGLLLLFIVVLVMRRGSGSRER